MPQSSRAARHADERNRAHEQELKRNRGAISCAECRRLKLKCDKTVPCSSCTRRGCASICPNGSLTTGQGTRFILADTDRLHRKIIEMSDRIRQLEDALAISHSSNGSRDPHPLLSRELASIKSGIELHSAKTNGENSSAGAILTTESSISNAPAKVEEETVLEVFGTLAVRDDGGARFFGSSAGQESLLLDADIEPTTSIISQITEPLPDVVENLRYTFPSAPSDMPADDPQDLIEGYLPPWPRAAQLCDLYLEQAPWFYGAVTRRQLLDELLPMFYSEAERNASNSAKETPLPPTPSTPSSSVTFQLPRKPETKDTNVSENTTPHDLALLFVVFCFGALTDPVLPAAPHNTEATRYFDLTRAALNMMPVLDGIPNVATVQTLSMMGIYQGMVADENSIEMTWAYMGLSCRLAQSVGLHRDCARWKLPPGEVQKRRALFWELFITDGFQSLATGRLPIFSLPFVDTELAADPDESLAEDGTSQPSFPAWKARFGQQCIAAIVQATTQARAPKYSTILELDRKIRDMELPKYATGPKPEGAGLGKTMSHFMPQNYRELALTYVHRCYFAQALSDFPEDPLRSPYAPSFLAGYRSACALLSSMREQFELFPVQLARFWVLWTHAFSATVMLASVVTHGGITKTAQAAMCELEQAYKLFERTSKHGGRATKFLPIVKRLHDKAYTSFNEGFKMQKDIFNSSATEKQDELSIFGGRTHTVKSKTSTKMSRKRSVSRKRVTPAGQSPSSNNAPSPESSGSSKADSPVVSPSLSQEQSSQPNVPAPSYYHSLETYGNSVHPMLVDQMRSFEGQLDAQINNAAQYYLTPSSSSSSVPSPDAPQPTITPAAKTVTPAPEVPQARTSSTSVQGWDSSHQSTSPVVPNPSPHVYHHPPEPIQQQQQQPQPHLQPHQSAPAPSPLEQHPLQPMLFTNVGTQPRELPRDVPMYGAVDNDIPTPMASTSQDQMQHYQAYALPITPSASQEYQHYDQQGHYAHQWDTTHAHQVGGDITMYPPGNTSFETSGFDPSVHPHPSNISQHYHHQYPTPPLSDYHQHQYHLPQPQHLSHPHTPITPVNPYQAHFHPQYHQQQPMMTHPPATPSDLYAAQAQSDVLHAQTGAPLSLQDAWTTFMQHELPGRGGPAGGQGSQNR